MNDHRTAVIEILQTVAKSCRLNRFVRAPRHLGSVMWVTLWIIVGPQTIQAADQLPPTTAQERLEAIRMSLIEATLQTPTTVRSMSWIDSRGGLHELSVFKNSLNVRGVQVKGYERTSEGQVKAQLDIQGQGIDSQACPQKLAGEKWRHPVLFYFQPDQRLHPVAHRTLALALQQEWLDATAPNQAWAMVPEISKPLLSNVMSDYERTLLGHTGGQQPWNLSLQASSRLIQIPRRGNWLTSDPWLLMRMALRLTPMERDVAPREAAVELRIPLITTDWGPVSLGAEGEYMIRRQLQTWHQTLHDWLKCEPIQARVLKAQGNQLTISAGRLAGVKSGDEWLIADPTQLPKQLLDPSGLQQTLLARASVVGVNTTQLTIVTGSTTVSAPLVLAQWQAWPLDRLLEDTRLRTSLVQAQNPQR